MSLLVSILSSPITPSSLGTWKYLESNVKSLGLEKDGRKLIVLFSGRRIIIPPYPEIRSVRLMRKGELIYPDIPEDFVAEWKANGSNIRIYALKDEIIATTRGGFLLDWKPYAALIESPLKERLLDACSEGRYVLFGELVGPKSMVRLCVDYWRKYLNADIGYLLFDTYDLVEGRFISLQAVEDLGRRSKIQIPPREALDVERLNSRLREFLRICHGEAWEGFVFKNTERGSVEDISKATFKWRLDETREYAEIIAKHTNRDPAVWKVYEALRKFVLEGYLDPPITLDTVDDEAWKIRNIILDLLEKTYRGEIPRDRADKKVKDRLYSIASRILSEEIKRAHKYPKILSKAIKIFRKIYVFTY